jgi:hypothetical protein
MTYKSTRYKRAKAKKIDLSKHIHLARGGQSQRNQLSELGFLSLGGSS